MDRNIIYPGSIPLDTDLLTAERNIMVALGNLIQSVLGSGPTVTGLTVGPTGPASMSVLVQPGSITQNTVVDTAAYGSLASSSNALVKMGVNQTTTTLGPLAAPGSAGQSINYLVQAVFQETDGTPIVLPYYNAANPAVPLLGPLGSGGAQNTLRTQIAALNFVAGAPATTGSQVTPAATSGWTALAVVTVAYGTSSITSGMITAVSTVPRVLSNLGAVLQGTGSLADSSANLTTSAWVQGLFGKVPSFGRAFAYGTSGAWSWTIPTNVFNAKVTIVGGGGGGAGSSTSQAGGGGGGGGTSITWLSGLVPGQALSGAIGTGAVAVGASTTGNNGGTTTLYNNGTLVATANGGGGGNFSANPAGGPGGSVSGGSVTFPGSYGDDGSPATNTYGGVGAAGYLGMGSGRAASGGGGGLAATSYGAGGGGSYGLTAGPGGAGFNGLVLIEY